MNLKLLKIVYIYTLVAKLKKLAKVNKAGAVITNAMHILV